MFRQSLKAIFAPPIVNVNDLDDMGLIREVAYLMEESEKNTFSLICTQVDIIEEERIDQLWYKFYFNSKKLPPNIRLKLRRTHIILSTKGLNDFKNHWLWK